MPAVANIQRTQAGTNRPGIPTSGVIRGIIQKHVVSFNSLRWYMWQHWRPCVQGAIDSVCTGVIWHALYQTPWGEGGR